MIVSEDTVGRSTALAVHGRAPLLEAPATIDSSRATMLAQFQRRCTNELPHNVRELLLPLIWEVSASPYLLADALGMWRVGDERFWIPRFVFQRTQRVKPRIKVAIFAGIHGDEPAGVLGLVDSCERSINARR